MSKIALTPNASGTGTLTVAAPNTNTDRTLTLPDVTTTLVGTDATQTLTNKSIASSQLTGALPAIDGSALTGIATGSFTLLGTLTTTSGSTVTLSGLNLTSYKQLVIEIVGVSSTSATDFLYMFATYNTQITQSLSAAANVWHGLINVMLDTGIYVSTVVPSAVGVIMGGTPTQIVYKSFLVNASTSVSFSTNSGNFDAGSIIVWGMK